MSAPTLKALLSPVIASDERLSDSAESIEAALTPLQAAALDGNLWTRLYSGDLSSKEMDHLAYWFSVSTWKTSWPDSVKQASLKGVVGRKRRGGTRWAVEQSVAILNESQVEITEWWEEVPSGAPYTFKVRLAANEIAGQDQNETQSQIYNSILSSMSARSAFDLIIATELSGTLGFYAAGRQAVLDRFTASSTEPS